MFRRGKSGNRMLFEISTEAPLREPTGDARTMKQDGEQQWK